MYSINHHCNLYLQTDGLRHSKTITTTATDDEDGNTITDTSTTIHVWDRNHITLELGTTQTHDESVDGNVTSLEVTNRYNRGARGHLISSDNHGWYLFDGRGSVIQRVGNDADDGTLIILHTYLYDAFGNELTKDADNTNPFRFNGEYFDSETNTYYLRARHFNPRTGRFTQPDPHWNTSNMIFGDNGGRNPDAWAIIQSGNLYAYTMGNPIRFTDPSGRVAVTASAIATAIAAGLKAAGVTLLGAGAGAAVGYAIGAGMANPSDYRGGRGGQIDRAVGGSVAGAGASSQVSSSVGVLNPGVIPGNFGWQSSNTHGGVTQRFFDIFMSIAVLNDSVNMYRYIPATLVGNSPIPSGPPMTLEQAKSYILNLDPILPNEHGIHGVMAFTESDALALVRALGGPDPHRHRQMQPEIHRGGAPGFFYHWHPTYAPWAHIWILHRP